jgi:hypothetical protein
MEKHPANYQAAQDCAVRRETALKAYVQYNKKWLMCTKKDGTECEETKIMLGCFRKYMGDNVCVDWPMVIDCTEQGINKHREQLEQEKMDTGSAKAPPLAYQWPTWDYTVRLGISAEANEAVGIIKAKLMQSSPNDPRMLYLEIKHPENVKGLTYSFAGPSGTGVLECYEPSVSSLGGRHAVVITPKGNWIIGVIDWKGAQ